MNLPLKLSIYSLVLQAKGARLRSQLFSLSVALTKERRKRQHPLSEIPSRVESQSFEFRLPLQSPLLRESRHAYLFRSGLFELGGHSHFERLQSVSSSQLSQNRGSHEVESSSFDSLTRQSCGPAAFHFAIPRATWESKPASETKEQRPTREFASSRGSIQLPREVT